MSILPEHCERILGISFFNGSAAEAVQHFLETGGLLVSPAAPALLKLKHDADYRGALQEADLAIPDSTLLVLLWKIATGVRLQNISGLSYLKHLLQEPKFRNGNSFWAVSSDLAKERALVWLREHGITIDEESCFVWSGANPAEQNHALLLQIEGRNVSDIVIATTGAGQETLGLYLRGYLLQRPRIHCLGAALGFLTGTEHPIPEWAQRHHLGWAFRLIAQPHMILPRFGMACALAAMVLRHRAEPPPLRKRWADI